MATATRKPQAARKPQTAAKSQAARKSQAAVSLKRPASLKTPGKPQAARKSGSARTAAGGRSAPSEFRLFENNAGDFQWVMASTDGTILAQSRPFASLAAAEAGAIAVRDGAAAARFERRPAETRSRGSA